MDITHAGLTEGKTLPPIMHFSASEAFTKYEMCRKLICFGGKDEEEHITHDPW